MDFCQFRQVAELVRSRHPAWFELDHDPPCSQADLERAETRLGTRLPAQYKEFMTSCGGGYFAFVNVFSATEGSFWGIVERNAGLPPGFIAVSDNGTGDYYGFISTGGECASEVCFLDHETGRVSATKYPDLFEYIVHMGLRL